jgi:hypothetical protein
VGHLGRAADRLHMSQSPLSPAIREARRAGEPDRGVVTSKRGAGGRVDVLVNNVGRVELRLDGFLAIKTM